MRDATIAARRGTAGGGGKPSLVGGLIGTLLVTGYLGLFLGLESESAIAALLVLGAVATYGAAKTGVLAPVGQAFSQRESTMNVAVVVGVLALALVFRESHFTVLMITTVLTFTLACLGLNIQFGYAGILNFAGASFLGVGGYTAAVLTMNSALPSLLIVLLGGVMASLIGLILIVPVVRTRGHYAAVVTIAFAILFQTFLEVNPVLGGPQGLSVGPLSLFGWDFINNIAIGDVFETSFYFNYLLLALVLLCLGFMFTRRLERSWIGLSMDASRLDETASACYGLSIVRWKITAFILGNFLIGVAGALYATMLSFIAPTNFTFADSLLLVAIVLLGGMGNPWGVAVASVIVVLLPEKLQILQEYRFLLFAVLVILMLRFRPEGLLPRRPRDYIPGGRAR